MNRRVTLILLITLGALAAIEALFAPAHHPAFPWHHWPGFSAALGLISCIILVKACKFLGRLFLQRPEESDD